MRGKRLTQAVLATALCGLGAYEAYTLVNRDEGDTLSEIVWDTTKRYTYTAFFAGVLAGHWFWPRPEKTPKGGTLVA